MIVPYSTALTLARVPIVTYVTIALCFLVFLSQVTSSVTEGLMYYPETWNPFKMLTSALAHGDFSHIFWNMVFYVAFAPALEVLIGNWLRYIWIMMFIVFAESIAYSLSVVIGGLEPLPTLGFSGVVMGMIGLSAYLMPWARIRVFVWYLFFGKTVYIPAWILAVSYLGLDTWEMLTADDFGQINVVAHVAGGFAGYLYGYFWLKDRREDTREALADEIAESGQRRIARDSFSHSYSGKREQEQKQAQRQAVRDHDQFMGKVYRMTQCHRHSDAVYLLMDRYDYLKTQTHEFEVLYEHIEEWGPSRTLLCFGRLIIYKLDQEERYGRAIAYIAKCQAISPKFVLPELSKVTFYAEQAIECGRLDVARNLLADPGQRYGGVVDTDACEALQEIIDQGGVLL